MVVSVDRVLKDPEPEIKGKLSNLMQESKEWAEKHAALKDVGPEEYMQEDPSNDAKEQMLQAIQVRGEEEEEEGVWPIEAVVDKRKRRGRTQYLVHFRGWSDEHELWYDEKDLMETARSHIEE